MLDGHDFLPPRPNKTRRTRQRGKTGKQQTKMSRTTIQRRTCKHAHSNASVVHIKRATQAKRAQGKRGAPGNYYPKPRANVRQRQEIKQSAKAAITTQQKPRAKNRNENKSTICAQKVQKKAQTTQGKRCTPELNTHNPKTPA